MPAPDPITEELFRNALAALGDEMVLTIYRTAYSGVLKNIMDYSAALCDAQGRLAAQGLALPGHLCSIPVALQAVLRHFGDDIAEGDILINNDPYDGGMHLPDIFIFKPLFADGRPIAYAATICHHTDVGGRVPGSNASDSTEIYAEGLRIPPLKLYERGKPNTTLFRMIDRNVRLPGRVLGDIRSQLAACEIAARGMTDLVARYGADGVVSLMNATMDYSERLTRHCLSELPDGEATFTDWIDDDQIDVGVPIPLVCTVRKRGDAMEVDWTGSAPQVKGAINNTWSYTAAMSFTAVKSVLSINMPNNDGVFRPIKVIAPPGTITNGKLPAACAARGLTGFRGVDCCFGALAKLYPDRVIAACEGGNTGITIGGYDKELNPFIYVDFLSGVLGRAALGGRAGWQHLDVRQHGELLGRGDRGGEPAGGAGLRIRARYRRRGEIPRRHVAAQDLADAGGRGDPPGARRSPDASAVRAARRRPWRGRPQHSRSRPADRGEAARQADHDAAQGSGVPPRTARRGRLGRCADARPAAGREGSARRAGDDRWRRRATTAWWRSAIRR